MSILDLPLEQQKRIAAAVGLPFEQWVAQVRQDLERIKAYPRPTRRQPSARAIFIQQRMDAETPSHFDVVMP